MSDWMEEVRQDVESIRKSHSEDLVRSFNDAFEAYFGMNKGVSIVYWDHEVDKSDNVHVTNIRAQLHSGDVVSHKPICVVNVQEELREAALRRLTPAMRLSLSLPDPKPGYKPTVRTRYSTITSEVANLLSIFKSSDYVELFGRFCSVSVFTDFGEVSHRVIDRETADEEELVGEANQLAH